MKTTALLSLVTALIAEAGSCLATDTVQLLSVRSPAVATAASADGDSSSPILSSDGRFVLFASSADDLLVMTNGARMPRLTPRPLNVFLQDRTRATTTLLSVNLTGGGGGNGNSLPAGLSIDGRYVLFESSASDLVPDDTNGLPDIFVRDLVTGSTVPVSISTNGDLGNGASGSAVMTPDGRYVAFVSAANNLVAGDTNRIPDVFLRDLRSGATVLVSVGASPGAGLTPYGSSEAPQITPDGRYVAFYSTAIFPVAGATNVSEIYVRDVWLATTTWASVDAHAALQPPGNTLTLSFGHSISTNGQFVTYEASRSSSSSRLSAPAVLAPGWGVILRYDLASGLTDTLSTNAAVPISAPEDAHTPVMTPDGAFVAFVANAPAGTITNTCILVWDAQTGASVLASGDLAGVVPTNSTCDWPAITPDGRFVAFISDGTNLAPNPLAGDFHLYRRNLVTATTTLVAADTNGMGAADTHWMQPSLSDDGRLVGFDAPDGSLVPEDSNKRFDVFVRDVATSVTELISKHDPALPSVAPNGASTLSVLSLSAEGSLVAFSSDADNVVPNDTNGYRDVFVRDLLADSTILVSADTSGAAPGNGMSTDPAISSDGRYVAFTSAAANLVEADTNGVTDIFVRDLFYGTTELVSANINGGSGNGASYSAMISADGKAVLFHSRAGDLVPDFVGSGIENLFWRDLWSGTTCALTRYPTNSSAELAATMTASGRFVVLGAQNANWYVWDSQMAANVYTNTTYTGVPISRAWASADANGVAFIRSNFLYLVDRAIGSSTQLGMIRTRSHAASGFSADGRFFAYATTSTNVAGDTNGLSDVYLYDWQTSSNLLVSQAFNARTPADGDSDSPAISPDGRFVAYRSAATNLVPNDENAVPDLFLWDRLTGATLLVSVSRSIGWSPDNRSLTPVFSADGRLLLFESWASDLITGDLNPGSDLFAFDIYSSGPIPLLKAAIVPGAGPGLGVWITWPVIPRKSYLVQFKDSLDDTIWQTLGGSVSIVGTQGYLYDVPAGGSQRYYRVVAQ